MRPSVDDGDGRFLRYASFSLLSWLINQRCLLLATASRKPSLPIRKNQPNLSLS